MSYALTSFLVSGTSRNLPTGRARFYVGTDDSRLATIQLPGGGLYDALGASKAPPQQRAIVYDCVILGANWSAVQTTFDQWRAWRGSYGALTATMPDASTRWRYCRLTGVEATRQGGNKPVWVEATLTFQPEDEYWKATAATQPSGALTANTTTNITANNAGDRNANRVTITITAGNSAITSVRVQIVALMVDWMWTGTLAATKSLVVNAGACTVKNDGANAYSTFTLHATNHKVREWLLLAPGNNMVAVTIAGGGVGSTMALSYYAAYE